MAEQPQVNPEHVINILRIRLNDEIYQRAMLEAAYNQQTKELNQLREQAATPHTQPSQQPKQWSSPKPDTWNPQTKQADTTTTTPAKPQETDATPADTSQKQPDTKQP